jgi:hypothetical protein
VVQQDKEMPVVQVVPAMVLVAAVALVQSVNLQLRVLVVEQVTVVLVLHILYQGHLHTMQAAAQVRNVQDWAATLVQAALVEVVIHPHRVLLILAVVQAAMVVVVLLVVLAL